MKNASLIQRVIIAVLLIEFVCALVFAGTSVWHEWRVRLRAVDVAIQGRADSLIGAVQDADDPGAHLMVDPQEFKPPSSDVYAVYSLDGQLVGTSQHAPAELVSLTQNGARSVEVDHHQYRVLQKNAMRIIDREETGGVGRHRPVLVVYAVGTDHLWHEVREAVSFYVLMGMILLCVTAAILVYLLRRLLAPLQELAAEASAIRVDSLAFAPPASVSGVRELIPLASALSSAIARLRLAFEKEQRFFSDATHELKTAVAVVRSTIQLLGMRNRSPEEYQRGLEQALNDNQRVEELVSQMLALARSSERAEETLTNVDLGEEVASALKAIASFAEHKDIQLVPSLASDVKVRLPQNAVQILVSNLVTNAVQHSPRGSEVRIAVRAGQESDKRSVLEVRDIGSGIAAENLPHVFERFFREDPSRSRETGGAGLGLSICKSIVESAGGAIELQSRQGAGTTVKVSFRPA